MTKDDSGTLHSFDKINLYCRSNNRALKRNFTPKSNRFMKTFISINGNNGNTVILHI